MGRAHGAAREGQEQLVATSLANGTGEAVRVQTALEVASELVLHVLRQTLARALVRVLEEALQVLLHDAVEDGFLGAALLVLLRFGSRHGARLQRWPCRCAGVPNLAEPPRSSPWRAPGPALASPGCKWATRDAGRRAAAFVKRRGSRTDNYSIGRPVLHVQQRRNYQLDERFAEWTVEPDT